MRRPAVNGEMKFIYFLVALNIVLIIGRIGQEVYQEIGSRIHANELNYRQGQFDWIINGAWNAKG